MTPQRREPSRRLRSSHTIDDLRSAAARRLPRAIFDTLDGAAGEEAAAQRNVGDLRSLTLAPRVLVDVSDVETSVKVLGRPIDTPLMLAPTGFNGLYVPEGELCVAAAGAGTIYVLSMFSSVSLEEVAGATSGRKWFQIYPVMSRDVMRDLIRRARQSNYEALCITVDVPVVGSRHRDLRSGIGRTGVSLPFLFSAACHPRWSLPFLLGYRPRFKSLDPYLPKGAQRWLPLRAPDLNPGFDWQELKWVLQEWNGRAVVKGILHPDDAERAVSMGAEAIIVSNHGGRQFEAAPSTLSVLPEIRARLGDERAIYVDGGVRSGVDVLKFLASGANACLCGRAYLYGLCAGGTEGVSRALSILRRELVLAMQLAGLPNLNRESLRNLVRTPSAVSSPVPSHDAR